MAHENTWERSEDYSQWIADSQDMIDWYRSQGNTNRKYRKPRTPEQVQRQREYWQRYAAEHHDELRARQRARHRQRMATDPEYAERKRATARAWYRKNRDRILEQRHHPKPEPRVEPGLSLTEQRAVDKQKARYRERMKDPEYVERRRAYKRRYDRMRRERMRAEPARTGTEPRTLGAGRDGAVEPGSWPDGGTARDRQRESYRKTSRKRKPKTREQKDRYNANERRRMATDPEYAARRRQAMRESYQRRKQDPAFVEQRRQRAREYQRRKREQTKTSGDTKTRSTTTRRTRKDYPR